MHTDGHLVGHSRRVADTARRIAQTMALPEGEAQEIFIAGLLHDVGQVGLPDALLAKPVPRMGPEELALYSKHPILGEQMLMALDDMQPVAALQRALAPPRAVLTGQLEPSMVLARDLVSAEGVVLLAADHVLTADLIQRICGYERREGLELLLHVRAAKR